MRQWNRLRAAALVPLALLAAFACSFDSGARWLPGEQVAPAVTCKAGEQMLKARLAPDATFPSVGDSVRLQVLGSHTCFYANEELVA